MAISQSVTAKDIVTPGTTTTNAVVLWGNSSGSSLINSGVLIDSSNNVSGITQLTASIIIPKEVEATLSGTYTMTEGQGQIFGLDPNGANRDVLLPPNPVAGLQIAITNMGTGGYTLIVKNSVGSTITGGTIANNVTLKFTYFTSGWRMTS